MGQRVSDWWELPCQPGTETNLDSLVGSGKAEESKLWERDEDVALRTVCCMDDILSVTFGFM
jgi:hypothetical protein